MHIKFLFIFWGVLFPVSFYCQAGIQGRIEIEAKNSADFFLVSRDSSLLVIELSKQIKGNIPVKFILFNKVLEKQDESLVQVPKSYEYAGSYAGKNATFVLFYDHHKGLCRMYMCPFGAAKPELIQGPTQKNMYVKNFVVSATNVFVLLTDREEAVLSVINMENGTERRTKLNRDGQEVDVINLELVPPGNNVYVSYRSCSDVCKNLIKRFDEEGNEKAPDLVVNTTEDLHMMDASSTLLSDKHTFVVVAFRSKTQKVTAGYAAHGAEFGNGVREFVVNIYDESGIITYTENYRLSDNSSSNNSLLNLHEIKPLPDNKFLVAGEFYYPVYQHTQINGGPVVFFDGYQYTHTFLAIFDGSGKRISTGQYNMFRGNKPMIARQNCSIETSGQKLNLLFADRSSINCLTLNEKLEVTDKKTREHTETELQELAEEPNVDILNWYSNHFLITGREDVVRVIDGSQRKRRVFFATDIMTNVN